MLLLSQITRDRTKLRDTKSNKNLDPSSISPVQNYTTSNN